MTTPNTPSGLLRILGQEKDMNETMREPSYILRQALDLLDEATSYTSCETWSPSLTDEINSFVVNTRAMLAADAVRPPQAVQLVEAAPQAQQAAPEDRLLREVFGLCEATEDAPEQEPKNEHQRGFEAGRRFEAKQIRRAIGTWFQDTFCGSTFMGEPAATPPQQAPATDMAVFGSGTGPTLNREVVNAALVLRKWADENDLKAHWHVMNIGDVRYPKQAPAPQPVGLTDEQIVAAANEAFDTTIDLDDDTLVNKYGHGVYISRYLDFARAAIAEFCRINGIPAPQPTQEKTR